MRCFIKVIKRTHNPEGNQRELKHIATLITAHMRKQQMKWFGHYKNEPRSTRRKTFNTRKKKQGIPQNKMDIWCKRNPNNI